MNKFLANIVLLLAFTSSAFAGEVLTPQQALSLHVSQCGEEYESFPARWAEDFFNDMYVTEDEQGDKCTTLFGYQKVSDEGLSRTFVEFIQTNQEGDVTMVTTSQWFTTTEVQFK